MNHYVITEELLDELERVWSFDDAQQHTHTWHDRADFIAKLRALPPVETDELVEELLATRHTRACGLHKMVAETDECDECCPVPFHKRVADAILYLQARVGEYQQIAPELGRIADDLEHVATVLGIPRSDRCLEDQIAEIREKQRQVTAMRARLAATKEPATPPSA